jgi:hypothetical protein
MKRNAVKPAGTGCEMRGAGTQKWFRFDTTCQREVGTGACARRAEHQRLAGASRSGLPHRHRLAIKHWAHIRTRDGKPAIRLERQTRADKLRFERRRARRIAHQQIGEPERPMIDRSGMGEARTECALSARPVLDGGLKPRFDDAEH